MKLAEALLERSDLEKRFEQIRARLYRVATVQEGDEPAEDPNDLLKEMHTVSEQLEKVIIKINRTNVKTTLEPYGTLADAITKRKQIMRKRGMIEGLIDSASVTGHRYSASEIKRIATVDVKELQKQIDKLSQAYREIDTAIQQANWTTDLSE